MQQRSTSNKRWVGYPHRPGIRRRTLLQWAHHDGDVGTEAAWWHYPAEDAADADGTADTKGGGGVHQQPRLLLIHGFRGDHHGMQLIVDALPEYEIFVPDLPGFGHTAPVTRPTGTRMRHDLRLYANFVTAFANTHQLNHSDILLGHSFGSLVAAAHIAEKSQNIASTQKSMPDGGPSSPHWAGLILAAPISDPVFSGPMLPGAIGVEAYYRLAEKLPEWLGDRVIRSVAAMEVTNRSMIISEDPQVRSFTRDQHARHFGRYADRDTLLEAYKASSRHTVAEFADSLELPVLLAAGTKDPMSTEVGRRNLRNGLPQARLEMIRGTGHLIHYEKPRQLGHSIRRFISGLSTSELQGR